MLLNKESQVEPFFIHPLPLILYYIVLTFLHCWYFRSYTWKVKVSI